jgi:hypothetical protein
MKKVEGAISQGEIEEDHANGNFLQGHYPSSNVPPLFACEAQELTQREQEQGDRQKKLKGRPPRIRKIFLKSARLVKYYQQ